MGIIVSSFPGCGKTYLMNTHGDKVKMLDAMKELGHFGEPTSDEYDYDYNLFVDAVMDNVGKYDIVFIPSSKECTDAFNSRNIDYDLFYPSKDRRGEFIENMVKKKIKPQVIMMLDREFEKLVDEIDNIENENCYKHKMVEKGHYMGNDNAIMQYITNVKQNKSKNEEKPSERMEKHSRSEANNEEDEERNA